QRTGSSKKADTADNDVNIDGAANPPSKETGDSKTVGQHKQYDQQQNKGGSSKKADTADNPANEDGGEGAILPKTDKEITNTRGCELQARTRSAARRPTRLTTPPTRTAARARSGSRPTRRSPTPVARTCRAPTRSAAKTAPRRSRTRRTTRTT